MMKLFSISIGNQCGEVFGKANVAKDTVTFIAKINGQTVSEGPVFGDLRELIVNIFSPKERPNEQRH